MDLSLKTKTGKNSWSKGQKIKFNDLPEDCHALVAEEIHHWGAIEEDSQVFYEELDRSKGWHLNASSSENHHAMLIREGLRSDVLSPSFFFFQSLSSDFQMLIIGFERNQSTL